MADGKVSAPRPTTLIEVDGNSQKSYPKPD